MGKDEISLAFDKWKKRVSNGYIKAVCKPCWEMKYCPYGSLVESFPIGDFGNDETCRIFGHICPVFYVAEPFTETKEMRNISRNIPMSTKLKVVRRDRYLCAMCKKTISDEEINYDHIIPWSKGGATTESNLRVLCADCNRKRGNEFESEYLVVNVQEAKYSPMTLELSQIEDLLSLFSVACVLREIYGTLSKDMFCAVIKTDDVETDEFMYTLIEGINNVFCESSFFIKTKKKETILKYRWGLVDGRVHSIYETCKKYHITEEYFCEQEDLLLRQIGFIVNKKALDKNAYYDIKVDTDKIRDCVEEILSMMDNLS